MVKRARKSSSSKSSRNSHILARYPNEKIIEMFSQMSKAMKNHGDFFRARAYNWAVATLRTIPKDLHSGSEASKYEGIGKSFAAKIDEILETGTFEEYEKEKKDPDTIAINELCSVFGIGAITAKRLLKHNIRNVEDLEQKGVHLGILNKIQQIGLKYRKDFGVPISRQEVLEFLRILTKLLEDLNEKMELVMCGGFRRNQDAMDVIQALIISDSSNIMQQVLSKLQESQIFVENIFEGSRRFIGVIKLPGSNNSFRRIEFKVVSKDNRITGIFFETGSGSFMNYMKLQARRHGMKLTEYGLQTRSADGSLSFPLKLNSEREIFDYFDMDYIPPENRNW